MDTGQTPLKDMERISHKISFLVFNAKLFVFSLYFCLIPYKVEREREKASNHYLGVWYKALYFQILDFLLAV